VRHPGSQAKGAYSTPVTVMNTNANSVPNLDTEKLARFPYQSNSTNGGCGSTCLYVFSAAPAGFRLVAENLSGRFVTAPSETGGEVGEIDDNSLNATVYFAAPLGEMQGTFSQAVVSPPIKAYVDSSRGAPFAVVNSRWSIGDSNGVPGELFDYRMLASAALTLNGFAQRRPGAD
jgi:hypothetical protein